MFSFVRSAYFPTNAKTLIVSNININLSQTTTHTSMRRQLWINVLFLCYSCSDSKFAKSPSPLSLSRVKRSYSSFHQSEATKYSSSSHLPPAQQSKTSSAQLLLKLPNTDLYKHTDKQIDMTTPAALPQVRFTKNLCQIFTCRPYSCRQASRIVLYHIWNLV